MPNYTFHVVSHTHWDREFYLPFQEFRVRFVDMIDDLLDLMERDPEFRYFHLDGQTVLVEDYLEVKPGNRGRVEKLAKAGRLLVGPRYQLNDHFLVSAEANVRNFLIGVRTAEELGGCMRVGYCADEFGMMSQFPQILRGFDIDNALFGRGIYVLGDRKMEVIWESPDGSAVLGIVLAAWFNNAQHVQVDDAGADALVENAKRHMGPITLTPHLLLLNGVDQMAAQPDLSEAIRRLSARLEGDRIVHSSLPEYIKAVESSLREMTPRQHMTPPQPSPEGEGVTQPEVFRGELREDRWGHALAGTLSTRMYLKQANDEAQKQLERYTEPVSALAWTLGLDYPWHTLDYAWRLLLKNHPHDSICGCSCDEAHQDMMSRFKQVMQIGTTLSREASQYFTDEIDTDSESLVVFNPLGWKRTERMVADVDFPLNEPFRGEVKIDPSMEVKAFELFDPDGRPTPFAVMKVSRATRMIMHPQMIMHAQTVKRFTIEFMAENVPGCGYRTYKVAPAERFREFEGWSSDDLCGENWLGNESLRVEFRDGAIDVTDLNTGRVYANVNAFEDCGEVGDEYRHIKPENDVVVKTDSGGVRFELVRKSPISATWKVEQTMMLPESATEDLKGRSGRLAACPITSYVTVARGTPRVEICAHVQNDAKDHRLRAVFPTNIKTDVSHAESQFDVITRPIRIPEDWDKLLASTWRPQLNWVDVNDGAAGICLINKGLPEFELYDDEDRTLALTLLRCVGLLATLDIAHIDTPTPDAQCQGERIFQYSLYPHSGNWREARVWRQAYEENVRMRAFRTGAHEGRQPRVASLIEVEPVELVVTAVKRAEREDKLIVRFFNTTDETIEGKVTARGAKSAELMNLNEEPKEKLDVGADGSVVLSVGPKKIVTLGFEVERLVARIPRGAARPDLRGLL
ncbi:MAG: glycoside hydrolase family 38 C-terminal domain-containing protein [Armatimonadota bacterium]|nr:glycoside hydrolase family 38 C-terminal domain-containing protein [Armatimonadota bacterium]